MLPPDALSCRQERAPKCVACVARQSLSPVKSRSQTEFPKWFAKTKGSCALSSTTIGLRYSCQLSISLMCCRTRTCQCVLTVKSLHFHPLAATAFFRIARLTSCQSLTTRICFSSRGLASSSSALPRTKPSTWKRLSERCLVPPVAKVRASITH